MITEQDLEQAIAECQGERNPNANTCIKLAAFLTIRNELFGGGEDVPRYSFASAPEKEIEKQEIEYDSDTEFGRGIRGKDWNEVLPIIDELMSVLQGVNRRLYDAVMRRLS